MSKSDVLPVKIGDVFTLNCGVVVTVANLKPLIVEDSKGNSRNTDIGSLRGGHVSWRQFGVPSSTKPEKAIRIGDKFKLNCEVIVQVVGYENCTNITVQDEFGNKRSTTATQLRRGQVSWREFGVRMRTKTDKRLKLGDRIRSKRNGFYEVVEIISADKIRITWDDYEISQYCTSCQIYTNSVKPRSLSHQAVLDGLKGFYVYLVIAKDSGEVLYVGKGKGRRVQHANSGMSHNYHLNRLHFEGKISHVKVFKDDLSEDEALDLERQLIEKHHPFCNTVLNPRTDFSIEI